MNMKNLIYEKPLLTSICIDLFFLISWILMINYNCIILLSVLGPIVGITNRKILTYGIGLKKKTRAFIYLSLFSVIVLALIYTYYYTCYIFLK